MNSKILLVKNIHIDRQYTNVLSYSEAQMLELCQANLVDQADNYSFLRPTGSIMAGFTYTQCLQANYIAFQNPDYSNKWFFAWIDDVIYKGDKNTEITFTVDAWSTWFDKWDTKVCFINRQHVNDDTIGLHTIPENLDVGIVEQYGSEIFDSAYGNTTYYVAIESSWDIEKQEQYSGISVYNNSIFGTQLYFIKVNSIDSLVNLYAFVSKTNIDKHIESITNMYIVPNSLIKESNLTQHNFKILESNYVYYTMLNTIDYVNFVTTIQKPYNFTDITIKNNKCYCYPYNYLYVTNNNGSDNIYKYENFSTENCQFDNELALTCGCSGRIVPKNYLGKNNDTDNAISLGKYPVCGWSADSYINWLTKNGLNIATNITLGALGLGVSVATGGVGAIGIAGLLTTAGSVAKTIGEFNSAKLLPNIKSGQDVGDIIWSSNSNKFIYRRMRCRTEYLKIIDDYFTRFGYAINKIELPNITGRKYWNYVEIGASEEIGYGEVPSKFMDIINNACRKGVTIWHNHANLGNYNLDNNII